MKLAARAKLTQLMQEHRDLTAMQQVGNLTLGCRGRKA
jgi:hypothetical protein